MSCMLCGKTGRVFNVYTNYGTANHSVRDDMIEIFGMNVASFLDLQDCVCNVCMNMLDNVAKLKRRLWPLISNPYEGRKPIKLGKIWDVFASIKLEEEDVEEEHIMPCRTPTPSSLLTFNYSLPYSRTLEEEIAERERHRSLSRTSSKCSRSDVSEVELKNIFTKKRRKRKGHNWSRHKRQAKSPNCSEFSYKTFPRRTKLSRNYNYSPLSDCSYISSYTIRKSPAKKKVVDYDEQGRLIRKRTRSVSRAQEEEVKVLEQMEGNKFYCMEKDCTLYFEDLDVLNHHRIIDHNALALHFCDECQQRYTSSHHLKLHMKIHDYFPFFCLMCGCEVENQNALQQHLDEHMIYSIPCKFCDKSFLDRKSCENHAKIAHRGKSERIVYKNKIIVDRFDSFESDQGSSEDNNVNKSDYDVVILHYTDMEYTRGDLDVTIENLKLQNIDFYFEDICSDNSVQITQPVEECDSQAISIDLIESEVQNVEPKN